MPFTTKDASTYSKPPTVDEIDPGLVLQWCDSSVARLGIAGDSELIVNWLNGECAMNELLSKQCLVPVMQLLYTTVLAQLFSFRDRYPASAKHAHKRWNAEADLHANIFRFEKATHQPLRCSTFELVGYAKFKSKSDGTSKGNPGPATAGWAF